MERNLLQLLLGDTDGESGKKKHTYGIDIKDFHISGNDTYHIWDFSGDVSHYTTHHFFLSTNHTIYAIVLDLSQPLPELRSELLRWAGLIKMHSMGPAPPYQHKENVDIIKLQLKVPEPKVHERSRTFSVPTMSKFRSRLHSNSSVLKHPKLSYSSSSSDTTQSSSFQDSTKITSPISLSVPFTPTTQSFVSPVPVLIVGSHSDTLSETQRNEMVQQMECFVQEMTQSFHPLVELLPHVININCLKPTPSDIKLLKEQISLVRAAQIEV